jgi:hypothetical protein
MGVKDFLTIISLKNRFIVWNICRGGDDDDDDDDDNNNNP